MHLGVPLTWILNRAWRWALALLAILVVLAWPAPHAGAEDKPAAVNKTLAKSDDREAAKNEEAEQEKEEDDDDDDDDDDEEEERERRKRWPHDRIRAAFHQFHISEMELVCSDCHEEPLEPGPRDELAFSKRPDHEACDACHEQFEALEEEEAEKNGDGEKDNAGAESEKDAKASADPPTFVCKMCHLDDEESLGDFPSGKLNLTGFSHAQHVDKRAAVHPEHGLREDCSFCHLADDRAALAHPRHQQCGACHAGDEAAGPVLEDPDEIEACQGCHSIERMDANIAPAGPHPDAKGHGNASMTKPDGGQWQLSEWYPVNPRPGAPGRPYRDILPFPHEGHLSSRDGSAIACATCHEAAASSEDITKATPRPTMRECGECHDRPALVGADNQTSNCQTCHAYIAATLRPRHSDPVSGPLAHGERFRIHHEEQAWNPERKCAACHVGTRDALDEGCSGCHASMQPRSHMGPRFNEMPHGRLAAFDRESCATCHTGDFCARCHNRAPRSHQPMAAFAGALGGAHRILATINLRSCFACHSYEPDCSGCHLRNVP